MTTARAPENWADLESTATPVRVPKAAELLAARLRAQIVRGELTEGQLLPPEPQLLKILGVGRPALREALRILESESLISVRRGARGGATVHLPSRAVAARYAGLLLQVAGTTLEDVYETRMILEPAAARRLAERGTEDDHAELRRAWEREHALVGSPVEWTHAAVDFHETVVDLAGLKALSLVSGLLREIIDTHESTTVESSVRAQRTNSRTFERASRAHGKLVDLVAAREAAAAEEFWRVHIDEAFKLIVGKDSTRTVLDLLSNTP